MSALAEKLYAIADDCAHRPVIPLRIDLRAIAAEVAALEAGLAEADALLRRYEVLEADALHLLREYVAKYREPITKP